METRNDSAAGSDEREGVAEFTFKAVVAGILMGILFGAANAYLGLKVGMTVSASIPAAVMTVAIFRLLRLKGTILEANLSQTIGSASTALASGTIFTIPALFLWGVVPPYLQVVILCFLGGLLGIAAMIPLRRLLIVDSAGELPYPEGTACAEVLRATAEGASGGNWIFGGMAIAAVVKVLVSAFFVVPGETEFLLPSVLPNAVIGLELAPSLIAIGFILGYRQSGIVVSGAILSALVLIPLITLIGEGLPGAMFPEKTMLISQMTAGQIWKYYVRYIGAGAVATAGIITVCGNLPTMFGAFMSVASGLTRKKDDQGGIETPRTDTDLPGSFVVAGIVTVVLVSGLVPGVFAGGMDLTARLVCGAGVGIFGILFVTVAARIVGIVGVSSNPTSGMTLVTLIATASIFAAFGWKGTAAQAAVLTVGTIVCVAAGKAGDIAQDLKTGYLVGATPWRQQFGQLIGACFACWAIAGTVMLLGETYGFGGKDLPAPQATLMKTIIEGVLSGELPWGLVFSGAGVTISAILCGVSGLAFAIGVYLPLSSMLSIFIGGVARAWAEGRTGEPANESLSESESDPGILAASGLVAGEGLAGIIIAGLVAIGMIPKEVEKTVLSGTAGSIAVAVVVLFVCFFLVKAARSRKKKG
ncbi:MAG TPA: oligopeptide transporter, OPT family [Candidatus Ozemobacteraceae bacterium]|nr:oligopeptide transporter, OPT family [Candidatus Ozemobacteraceae bacterium]